MSWPGELGLLRTDPIKLLFQRLGATTNLYNVKVRKVLKSDFQTIFTIVVSKINVMNMRFFVSLNTCIIIELDICGRAFFGKIFIK